MEKRTKKILIVLFIVTLSVRLLLAFLMPNFTYESYFHIRQVEHILDTGLPLYNDDLSYGGRQHLFLPFFYYFMAFFSLLIPVTVAAKIIPNILIASITVTVFLISYKITKNEPASLLSALIAGFLPILFYTNSFTVDRLFLPLTFVALYAFLNVKKRPRAKARGVFLSTPKIPVADPMLKQEGCTIGIFQRLKKDFHHNFSENIKDSFKQRKFLYLYIFSFLILSMTSSLVLILIVGFWIYILLSRLEGKKIHHGELEIIIFSLFFFLWTQFLFFKNALLQEGVSFFWQNVPTGAILHYFPSLSLPQALLLVSIIPFIAGIFIVYKSLFKLKNQKAFLLISFVISTTLLTWMRLTTFKLSLAFFGVILAILFAPFYIELNKYFRKTKLSQYKKYVLPVTVILLLISTVIPAINASLNQDIPSREEITAFKWLKENTSPDSTILSTIEEGHLVTYYSERKNMMDDQFRLIKNVNKRFEDLTSLYTTYFETQAVKLAEEYDLKYFVLTPSAKVKYSLIKLNYAKKDCFTPVYINKTTIYLVRCEVEEINPITK